ncbi:tetratricopeptide repeat protein [Candidatus Entotheonella palauensis]|uniref:tetratricopeptide repeat protein n=1 Tax=Candidatus Entotheonella palauensis TaxID=93172 RepID=UPI000B7FA46F|nr:tetratricopeptide repeat protein [Candidatus Entotheonella palauensis]
MFKFVILIVVVAMSLCTGCGQSDEALQAHYLETARVALRQGDYEQALLALNHVPATSSPSKEFYLMQGLAHFKMREFHHAMDAFEKADPSSLALMHYLGYLYLFLGEVETAALQVKQLQTAHGSPPSLALLNGNIQLQKRAFDASRAAFANAASKMASPAQAYIGLGNVALFEQDMAAAEQHFLSAVLVDPHHLHVYHVLAKFYILMSRYDEAEANLHLALQKFPNHVNTVILLGNLLIRQGRCADALSLYRDYRSLLPSSSVLNLQILRCMLKEKQYAEATEMIRSFQSQNSRKTLLVSGELNLRKGDVEAALSDFYRIADSQDDFIVDYYLGVVYLERFAKLIM